MANSYGLLAQRAELACQLGIPPRWTNVRRGMGHRNPAQEC